MRANPSKLAGNADAAPARQPRRGNPVRPVRVEDTLWADAAGACATLGTTRSEVIRKALRKVIRDAANRRT